VSLGWMCLATPRHRPRWPTPRHRTLQAPAGVAPFGIATLASLRSPRWGLQRKAKAFYRTKFTPPHRIGALRLEKKSLYEIARRLGRAASTVSREIRRNRYPTDGHYRAYHAQSMASGRRRRSRSGGRFGAADRRQVERLLRGDWSPEQIAGHGAATGGITVSHETIYRWVWAGGLLLGWVA